MKGRTQKPPEHADGIAGHPRMAGNPGEGHHAHPGASREQTMAEYMQPDTIFSEERQFNRRDLHTLHAATAAPLRRQYRKIPRRLPGVGRGTFFGCFAPCVHGIYAAVAVGIARWRAVGSVAKRIHRCTFGCAAVMALTALLALLYSPPEGRCGD